MDILDLATSKDDLAALLEAHKQKFNTIDAVELAGYIKARVIGQDKVADDVASQIRRRLVMKQRGKPVGVFCFAGPPGVGKTYFAKVLAEKMYGDKKALQFFDMSQYGQAHACSTLFGQSKGYVGSDSYGKLTAALRDYPKCIVLLDEFEKADSEVHKRFLTAWNDGFITEASDGKKISTTDAVFILTTNAAAEKVGELAKTYADDRDMLVKTTKTCLQEAGFAPEVLSRIDHVFAFCSLEGMDVARVVALEVIALLDQYDLKLADQGIDPTILLDAIAKSDKGVQTNVREIARSIEQQLGDSLLEAKEAGAKTVRIISNDGVIVAEAVELNS